METFGAVILVLFAILLALIIWNIVDDMRKPKPLNEVQQATQELKAINARMQAAKGLYQKRHE